jgi:hypothetical protein
MKYLCPIIVCNYCKIIDYLKLLDYFRVLLIEN